MGCAQLYCVLPFQQTACCVVFKKQGCCGFYRVNDFSASVQVSSRLFGFIVFLLVCMTISTAFEVAYWNVYVVTGHPYISLLYFQSIFQAVTLGGLILILYYVTSSSQLVPREEYTLRTREKQMLLFGCVIYTV